MKSEFSVTLGDNCHLEIVEFMCIHGCCIISGTIRGAGRIGDGQSSYPFDFRSMKSFRLSL